MPAGELRVGEQVVELGGRTATVTALAVRPGAAAYYNLTVSTLHTYVVGGSHVVVHNCNEEAQADLARMRAKLGMSTPEQEKIDVANKIPGAKNNTLGRMDFDGGRDSIYGQNGRLPRPYAYPGKGFGIAPQSFEDHAEGDMVSQAAIPWQGMHACSTSIRSRCMIPTDSSVCGTRTVWCLESRVA